ncbi:hypothetical protein [Psychroserpens sp. NJDZ02]|uniref:hypothetical protein n=1 Tax=Psychroserpens sp. NJDZ02 TaxID=2570561 RepID=UPI0010A909C3|nr:hypothetical protein [Psychroserpens sp. NJDZ02]QCE42304.1 hypothetical protein E9099_13130 [Psychroserpens sp. NJDZ02]
MTFEKDFFIALNNWQKGWKEDPKLKLEFENKIIEACKNIPLKYKVCKDSCYRKRFIHKGDLVDIFYNNEKNEGFTSWTTDKAYAEFFKGKYKDNAVTAAIFEHKPKENEVILNINKLWECSEFEKQLKAFSIENIDDCKAIYHFKDIQGEVILNVPLKGNEIYGLTGISSPFDDICDSANISEEDRPKKFKELIDKGAYIEEITYVKGEAAKNAINNTIWQFHELLENIKDKK